MFPLERPAVYISIEKKNKKGKYRDEARAGYTAKGQFVGYEEITGSNR